MPLTEEERAEVTRLLEAQGDGQKFRDPDFPHDESSLALEDREDVRAWRRPRKIASKPRLFVEGAACSDVEQGTLGDCWFLAAATAVAQYPDLIRQVIPDDQPLFGKDYHGILVFRFWKMGNWNSIYIDDKLPVDEYNGLVYGRCTTEYEFWLPLVEKAFAKFHGNYENIVGGFPSEAFLSLTGYIVEESYLSEANIRDLYRLFAVELKNNSIIACATESTRRRGLVGDHAYTVTGVGSLRLGSGLVRLVRVRNPHASTEWQGAWADSDPNWNEIDGKTLDSLGYENKDDGQFWIKMSHFKKHFPDIYLAARLPDFGDDYATASRQFYSVNHSWETGVNSGGGNVEDTEKFVTNPQYTLIIRDTDCPGSVSEEEEEEEEQEEGLEEDVETCDVVVELIQEQDRAKYDNLNFIGITIFKVSDDSLRRLGVDDMNGLEPHQGSVEHVECSAVVTRLHLTPGNYIVVPSILEPDVSRSFLMRVYSRKPIAFIC